MGDIEEPPNKVTKFQMDSQFLEGDVTDEGHEEWLSEGILTDDDYNPASQPEADHGESNSQDETNVSEHEDVSQMQGDSSVETETGNIEETLNNFEKSEGNVQEEPDISDELETFLIRKSDGKPIGVKPVERDSRRQSEDDGNDTDDLLRVLGDGDQRDKDQVKKEKGGDDDDDDDYIFEGSNISAKYQAAKSALMNATATKAEPEDDITDCSSDEVSTVKKMFMMKPGTAMSSTPIKTVSKPAVRKPAVSNFSDKQSEEPKIIKKVINVAHNPPQQKRPVQPSKQYINKKSQNQSILKPNVAKKPAEKPIKEQSMHEDYNEYSDVGKKQDTNSSHVQQPQRLMRPEEMDEEVPSDMDSESDEDTVYDELPSSDSDALEDWFTLDVRAERAGDYLPLLGDRAYQLLVEEKQRVSSRISSLKKSLSALTSSARSQADELRRATATVAELDAMLKAA